MRLWKAVKNEKVHRFKRKDTDYGGDIFAPLLLVTPYFIQGVRGEKVRSTPSFLTAFHTPFRGKEGKENMITANGGVNPLLTPERGMVKRVQVPR